MTKEELKALKEEIKAKKAQVKEVTAATKAAAKIQAGFEKELAKLQAKLPQ